MLSATGITAAIAILALSVSVTENVSNPPSQVGSTHIVAADGSGDYATIAEAVKSVSDGDTVLVRPGTYAEAFTIYQDITLAGDGPVGDIVITAPVDPPIAEISDFGFGPSTESYAVRIKQSDAAVTGLTFSGEDTTVLIEGGSPMLHDLVFDGTGRTFLFPDQRLGQYGIVIHRGSTASFTENEVRGGAGIAVADRSEPTIEGNILSNGAGVAGSMGDAGVVRRNVFEGGITAIYLSDPSGAHIEDNAIRGASDSGIQVASSEQHQPVVRGNVISDVRFGIQLSGGMPRITAATASGSPLISENHVAAELVGISIGESDSVVRDNVVRDSLNGIVVGEGASEIMGNDVEVSGYGIDVGAHSSASVVGNTVCGGQVSIKVNDTATPAIGENSIC